MFSKSEIQFRINSPPRNNLSCVRPRPKVWSLPERQAWFAIYEIAAGCFELGKTSIKLSHEAIAFLSADEVDSAAARSRGQPLAAATSAITIASTELQKAVQTVGTLGFILNSQIYLNIQAQVAMSALKQLDWGAYLNIGERRTPPVWSSTNTYTRYRYGVQFQTSVVFHRERTPSSWTLGRKTGGDPVLNKHPRNSYH